MPKKFEQLSFFMKIFYSNIFLLLMTVISYPQQESSDKQFPPLDTTNFSNSAHHWYDIYSNDNVINPAKHQPRYQPTEIKKIADNILLYQKDNGGWPKNYDMLAILSDKQIDSLISLKRILNTTFDNWTTHPQVEYLAQVYTITKEEKYKNACLHGLDFIISAQYPNGGWPQFWPDTSGYSKYITFNDGAFIGIMTVLFNIVNNKTYYFFVDDILREKVKLAYYKGLNCILKCQIREKGVLYAWGQQHDNIDLRSQWARAFEPPCICNGESAFIVLFLMNLQNPGEEVIQAVQSAVKWFNDSKIYGIRVEIINAPKVKYRWRTSSTDRVVVEDLKVPPIWTRYYELGTHRSMFCNRDRKVVYSLEEVDRERRDGYSWYTYAPQEVLDKYPEWQKKWAPKQNILN